MRKKQTLRCFISFNQINRIIEKYAKSWSGKKEPLVFYEMKGVYYNEKGKHHRFV